MTTRTRAVLKVLAGLTDAERFQIAIEILRTVAPADLDGIFAIVENARSRATTPTTDPC